MGLLDKPLGTVKTIGAASTASIGKLGANAGVDIGAVEEVMPTAGAAAQVTTGTAGTYVILGTFACAKGVTITCDVDSLGYILLAWALAAGTASFKLYQGQSVFIPISNTNKLFADSSVTASKFSWIAT